VEQPQEVEDGEHERVWQRVAAIDVVKASGWCAPGCPATARTGSFGPGGVKEAHGAFGATPTTA
jgi:hypothetical protein